MARREAIEDIMKCIDDELIICNIGFPSRELYDIEDREENFYMIGSMGLASSIGLGLALAQPERDIVVIVLEIRTLMLKRSIWLILLKELDLKTVITLKTSI